MQSISTPSLRPAPARVDRLLVLELWGLGDLALAMPFLRAASADVEVTLLAKPHAAPLLARFCPAVKLVPLVAPWTAFRGKYRFHTWPWRALGDVVEQLQTTHFNAAVSARPDPRDHAFMALSGAPLRAGFPRRGSGLLLTDRLAPPVEIHRARHWETVAAHFGWTLPPLAPAPRTGNHLVVHTGAGQPLRAWPRDRFEQLATRAQAAGWRVTLLDDSLRNLDQLLDILASADRFLGNDSGPGHLAALIGVPTFTVFGPQLPALFVPQHPQAAWIEGSACRFKPCFDDCRFASPHCILELTPDDVWARVEPWLRRH